MEVVGEVEVVQRQSTKVSGKAPISFFEIATFSSPQFILENRCIYFTNFTEESFKTLLVTR